MGMMSYDAECLYGDVPMPYRNPESCKDMPDFESDSNQARKYEPSLLALSVEPRRPSAQRRSRAPVPTTHTPYYWP